MPNALKRLQQKHIKIARRLETWGYKNEAPPGSLVWGTETDTPN
ncbi:MAG: hypothetical protein WBA07_30355 [Rivularia sp. (in: cyanobacteria)]